jgi:periplasmic divalent cation tolerance protein
VQFAEAIRRRRAELRLSQAELAAAAGVDKRQIRRYEAGEQQPALGVALAMAKALDLSLDDLGGAGVEPGHGLRGSGAGADGLCEVILTAPDADWLADLTHQLVEDRLAACGHVIAAIRSIYRWEGGVHDEPEDRVALDTRLSLVPEIIDRTKVEHPYKVPSIAALPITGGSPEYSQWIRDETS